jgi:hypothetical protein
LLKLTHSFRTSQHAAAFGARGTPSVMRLHEIMGIEANRSWGVCSLNDFRKFLGLKSKLISLNFSHILRLVQHTPVSWNGTPTPQLLKLLKSFMVTLTTWSCMLVSRPSKPNLLERAQDFVQVLTFFSDHTNDDSHFRQVTPSLVLFCQMPSPSLVVTDSLHRTLRLTI